MIRVIEKVSANDDKLSMLDSFFLCVAVRSQVCNTRLHSLGQKVERVTCVGMSVLIFILRRPGNRGGQEARLRMNVQDDFFFCRDNCIPLAVASSIVVVVVVSHIQRIGCQPEKTTLHGGQSRSWSAEQGKKKGKKKSPAAPPLPSPPTPPPRARAARSGKKKKKRKKEKNHATHPHI